MPTGRALAAALLLVACGGGDETVRAAAPSMPGTLRMPVDAPPVAYAWEGAGRVPWTGEQLVFGERGRDPFTGLYLAFNDADVAGELASQPAGWRALGAGLEPAAGRFGGGARLVDGTALVCELPARARDAGVWSVELWIRPEALGPATLLELDGVIRVDVGADGRLWATLPGALRQGGEDGVKPTMIGSKRSLAVGQWHHVGVVVDVVGVRGMRVVVDGEVAGVRVEPEEVTPPARMALGDGLRAELDELRFVSRNLTTSELREHARARPGPREELTLFRADGETEAREYWPEPITDGRLDEAGEWARGELVHLVEGPEGLRWTEESWYRVPNAERPLARTTHPTVTLGDGRIFVYGGETRDSDFGRMVNTDDTWLFDLEREEWRRVARSPAPSPRCHMPAAYSPDHDVVLLVGGWKNDEEPGEIYGDYWLFHVGEERWERKGELPDGMTSSDHGLVYLQDRGCFMMAVFKHVYLYWPDRDEWERRRRTRAFDERGEVVDYSSGCSTMSVYDPVSKNVFQFGGSHGNENTVFVDTTAVYDVETNMYTVLDTDASPSPRVRGAMAYDSKRRRFVYFGGVQGQFSDRYDDLWTFDPATRVWREVPRGQGRPTARGGYYGMGYDARSDRFVLPMGRHAHLEWVDETVVLSLDDEAPGRGTWVFDRDGAAATAWSADVVTPGDSSASFRFRTSEDGTRFGEWSDTCPPEGRFLQVEATLRPGTDGEVPLLRSMGF